MFQGVIANSRIAADKKIISRDPRNNVNFCLIIFFGWLPDLVKRNNRLLENDTGPRKNINLGGIMFLSCLADLIMKNSILGENDTEPRENINPSCIMFEGFISNLGIVADKERISQTLETI